MAGLVDFIESIYVVRFSVVNMSDGTNVCPLCQKSVGSEDKVVIREKGAEGINKASIDRGAKIQVSPVTVVHISCRKVFINKKDIEYHKASLISSTIATVKRSTRLSSGQFNNKCDCIFCEKNSYE